MATFKAVVFEHHKREDGTFNVKIRVTHNRKSSYIQTAYYVSKKQLTKDFIIKDPEVNERINDTIKEFRKTIVKLGGNIQMYTAKELAEYLDRKTSPASDNQIDFVEFYRLHLDHRESKGKKRTADNMRTTLNSLIDFFKRDKIMITEITSKTLEKFESYLRSPRKITRNVTKTETYEYSKEPLTDVGVINYMTNIRTVFNAAIKEFNDDEKDDIRISHYPFKKYSIGSTPQSEKRNIKPEVIKLIRDTPDLQIRGSQGTNRASLGRDVFMLSFYLVGMNTVDLFKIDEYKDGRLTYRRSKTADRRADEALISIKVEPEVEKLIEKYRDKSRKRVFCFYQMYANEQAFNKAVNFGLKKIAEHNKIEEDLSSYFARHSWATIARNECRVSVDDIGVALNHTNPDHRVTDIYIEKDWRIIDEANRKVLDTLK